MKKIVLAALLGLAYQASFAAGYAQAQPSVGAPSAALTETSHDLSQPTAGSGKNVTYEVTFSRNNQVLKQETLATKIGVPASSSIVVTRDSTNCNFTDASGAPVNLQYSLNDETTMAVVPSAEKGGRIETIIDARIYRATPDHSVTSGTCTVQTGQSRSISVVDFVPMHEGDTRTYNLADGTVAVLKLTKGGAPSAASN